MAYADFSLRYPKKLKIVGVADPDKYRQKMVSEKFGFSKDFCFDSAEDLAKAPKFADAVIKISTTSGLCSFYAEQGGMLVGIEC